MLTRIIYNGSWKGDIPGVHVDFDVGKGLMTVLAFCVHFHGRELLCKVACGGCNIMILISLSEIVLLLVLTCTIFASP